MLGQLTSETWNLAISTGNCLLGDEDSIGDGESLGEQVKMEDTRETN